jgi:hypothetical protein
MSRMQWSGDEDRSGSTASYHPLMARSELPKPSIDQFEVKRTFHYLREYALSEVIDVLPGSRTVHDAARRISGRRGP